MAELPNGAVAASASPYRAARKVLGTPALAVFLAALCALPLVLNDYVQFVVNTILVYALLAVGFNVVIGYLGQLAFANAAFFGVGAYATGLSMVHFGLPFPLAAVLGCAGGALAGLVVGLPALRVRGYYLAITTLAFGELMRWLYVHGGPITFGPSGFNVPAPTFFGWPMQSEGSRYYVFLLVTATSIALTTGLLRSRFGRAFVAIRNNESAAAAAGIDVARSKVLAFIVSGALVGLAGALYAALNGRITPDTFGLGQLLIHFAIVMIGGLGSVLGSICGAVLLTAAPEVFRNLPGVQEIIFSVLLIVVLFFMPKGIGGVVARYVPALRERLYRE